MNMRWQAVNNKQIKRVIKQMNSNKLAGCDPIRMADIKLVCDKVSPVIAKLINLYVKYKIFPSKLKQAIIRPMYKNGCHKNYNNYRPIALLSSVDKIMEK